MEAVPKTPSAEAPYPPAQASDRTPLQGHAAYFDRSGDGIIWPIDTYLGFRALGYAWIICIGAVFIVNGGMSYVTMGSWIPDPFFRVKISNMHKAKHGSDSNAYNRKGQINEANFEEIFATYSSPPNYDTLTFDQALQVAAGNRDPYDFFGWFANWLEWAATYLLIWPEDGKMKKSDIRGVYDGSLFFKIAEENAAKAKIAAYRKNRKNKAH